MCRSSSGEIVQDTGLLEMILLFLPQHKQYTFHHPVNITKCSLPHPAFNISHIHASFQAYPVGHLAPT